MSDQREPAQRRTCPGCGQVYHVDELLDWQGQLYCLDCHARLLAEDLEAWERRQEAREQPSADS